MAVVLVPPPDQFLRDEVIRGGMDLLFFANTRHLRRADEMLAACGLGRAHHRVLYFLARRPGITVSELLTVLGIAKQSLRRASRDLLARQLIYQERGKADARHRLYRLTTAGVELEQAIFTDLHDNVARAYAAAGGDAVAGFWSVLQHLIGEEGRTQFCAIQEGRPGEDTL